MVPRTSFFANKITSVFFDFIGTLVRLNPEYETSVNYLYEFMKRNGLASSLEEFKKAYAEAYNKHLKIRQTEYREVTNSVWLSEALNSLGYVTAEHEDQIKAAIDQYFNIFTAPSQSISCVEELLRKIRRKYRVGLISNFTYAPAVYRMLEKFNMLSFFDTVVISHEIGYRKPHPKIFHKGLNDLSAKPQESVMVGDTFKEDIIGAKALGIRTILVDVYGPMGTSYENKVWENPPDLIIKEICELKELI